MVHDMDSVGEQRDFSSTVSGILVRDLFFKGRTVLLGLGRQYCRAWFKISLPRFVNLENNDGKFLTLLQVNRIEKYKYVNNAFIFFISVDLKKPFITFLTDLVLTFWIDCRIRTLKSVRRREIRE